MGRVVTHNEKQTTDEGEKLGRTLKPGDIVALHGNLGAGKTVFTQGIAKGLGIDASVSSPTFTIVNEYPGCQGHPALFHFDMYRIDSEDELFDIGWDDYQGRGGICVVEWSEKVPGAFPPGTFVVRITNCGENKRSIEIEEKS